MQSLQRQWPLDRGCQLPTPSWWGQGRRCSSPTANRREEKKENLEFWAKALMKMLIGKVFDGRICILVRAKCVRPAVSTQGSHQKKNPVKLGTLSQVACHPPLPTEVGTHMRNILDGQIPPHNLYNQRKNNYGNDIKPCPSPPLKETFHNND